MDLIQKIEKLKTRGIDGEEFFLIFNGGYWCAGYMQTPGIIPEMDIKIEVIAETIEGAINKLQTELDKRLKAKQRRQLKGKQA